MHFLRAAAEFRDQEHFRALPHCNNACASKTHLTRCRSEQTRTPPPASTSPQGVDRRGRNIALFRLRNATRLAAARPATGPLSVPSCWSNPALPIGYLGMGPAVASALKVFAHLYEERGKPEFDIEPVDTRRRRRIPSAEEVVLEKPFGNLRRFRRDGLPDDAPKLLIVAPMSGHYATLLRGTVQRMVENQEVYDHRLGRCEAGAH